MDTDTLISALGDFSEEVRRDALTQLASTARFADTGSLFNMHCHSFFSYNADGWSPSRVAYECRSGSSRALRFRRARRPRRVP